MKIKIFGGLLIAALAITSIADAQSRTPVIDRREHRQERRINDGVRTHELSRGEARNLRGDERRLNRDRRMAMADGHVDRRERAYLRHEENRNSRAIYREKHNGHYR